MHLDLRYAGNCDDPNCPFSASFASDIEKFRERYPATAALWLGDKPKTKDNPFGSENKPKKDEGAAYDTPQRGDNPYKRESAEFVHPYGVVNKMKVPYIGKQPPRNA